MKHLVFNKDRQIAVYFHGKKRTTGVVPLVLLHGFCEDSTLWNPLIPLLSEIPIIAIDLPGFGESDQPHQPDMASYAESVRVVLDDLEIAQCVLIGHSLGGYVALAFAARWGDRLAGLGLFHSHPFPDTEERKTARMRGVEMLRSGKRDLYVSQLFPNLFAPAYAQAYPEVVQAVIDRGKQQPVEGIIAALQAMIHREDHQATLVASTCPVLFLVGAEDSLIPLDQAWKAALLPDVAMITVMEGVGHMGMFEDRGRAAQTILALVQYPLTPPNHTEP